MTRVRSATPTVAFIDQYCAHYRALFHNVRHFEQFTALHLGVLAETRRTSLPRLGTTVHADPQAVQHFLAPAAWSVQAVRTQRLAVLRQALGETPFILCLEETGDRKKGHTTDYVLRRQPVHRQSAYAGQWGRLGECLWRVGHHHLSAPVPRLQAAVAPQAGRCRHE
jgi:SRSO17 transposase